jgi:hypothetical protein
LSKTFDQLAEWQIGTVGTTPQRRLYLRCRNEIAAQIESSLGEGVRPRIRLQPEDWDEWTHRYPLTRELTQDEIAFLDAMKRALTFRNPQPAVLTIAMDHYQDPASSDDPMDWAKTEIGNLVHEGKYAESDEALALLAEKLSWFIARHGTLRSAEVITAVPSHSARRFSERLARRVGDLSGTELCPMTDDATKPVKDTDPATRSVPRYRLDDRAVQGKRVLIIDDLMRSGESVRRVVKRVHSAQPQSVAVLAAVKTMRN